MNKYLILYAWQSISWREMAGMRNYLVHAALGGRCRFVNFSLLLHALHAPFNYHSTTIQPPFKVSINTFQLKFARFCQYPLPLFTCLPLVIIPSNSSVADGSMKKVAYIPMWERWEWPRSTTRLGLRRIKG